MGHIFKYGDSSNNAHSSVYNIISQYSAISSERRLSVYERYSIIIGLSLSV